MFKKIAGNFFPGIGAFSSLILSFQAVKCCVGEILYFPTVDATCPLSPSVESDRPRRDLSYCAEGQCISKVA